MRKLVTMLAVTSAAITLVVGPSSARLASAAPALSNTIPGSDPSFALPLTGLSAMAVDDAHQHVFLTGNSPAVGQGTPDSVVVVMDFDGTLNSVIQGLPGAAGMYLDASAHKLYVLENGANAIQVIDTNTLTLGAVFPLGSGVECPLDVAKAAGRLWTNVTCGVHQGRLAALDLSTMAVTVYPVNGGQMIRADPANSNLLFAGALGGSPGVMWKYNVSSGSPVQVGEAGGSTQGWSNLEDFAIEPDGGDVVPAAGAPYYLDALKVSNLSSDVQYNTGPYPLAVAVSPDSKWVVGGVSAYGSPSVMLFADGNATPVDSFDPAETGAVVPRGLAMSADDSKLFVVSNFSSTLTFTVVPDPRVPPSTLTLSKDSGFVPVDDPLSLPGTLTFSDGASAAGQTIHIFRTDPASVQTQLPDVTTDGSGGFTVDDTPSTIGSYLYTAVFDGSPTHRHSSVATYVTTTQRSTVITISASALQVVYGKSVTLTGHLAEFDPGEVVSIYRTSSNGTTRIVGSGVVDQSGDFSLAASPPAETLYYAHTDGDTTYTGANSTRVTVQVFPIVKEGLRHFYAISKGYELYHYEATCPQHGKGCPTDRAEIEPNHYGSCAYFRAEVRTSTGWHDLGRSKCIGIDGKSEATVIFVYANRKIIGKPLRVRAEFPGDGDHLAQDSVWRYFKVTR
jgi:hypothetical protein